MNTFLFNFLFIILPLLFSKSYGAQSYDRNVIKETYTHSYGIVVTKSDWIRRGKDGLISKIFKDGTSVNEHYVKGVLQGEVTYSFPHSEVISIKEIYEQGTLTSRTQYFRNSLPEKKEVINSDKTKTITCWYEGLSTIASIETLSDSVIINGEYHSPSGQLFSTIQDGNGKRSCFSLDGRFLYEETFVLGILAEKVSFYPNKDPMIITRYNNNVIHGLRQTFFPGGIPNTVEEWSNGEQDGLTLVFKNGQKASEIPFIKGKRHGLEIRYNDNGDIVEEVSWKHNVLHGIRKLCAEGTSKIEWYHQGKLVSKATYERLNISS